MYRILKLLSPFNNLHVNVSILLSHLYYFFCATIYFVLKAVSENSFIDSFKLNTLLCSILRISVQEIWVLNIFKIIPIYHASDDEDTIKSCFYSTCVLKSASKHRCSRYTSKWKKYKYVYKFFRSILCCTCTASAFTHFQWPHLFSFVFRIRIIWCVESIYKVVVFKSSILSRITQITALLIIMTSHQHSNNTG